MLDSGISILKTLISHKATSQMFSLGTRFSLTLTLKIPTSKMSTLRALILMVQIFPTRTFWKQELNEAYLRELIFHMPESISAV